MQTKEQIHNANLLQKAMEHQKIASKACQAYEALSDLFSMNYEQFLEPADTIHLMDAQSVLVKINEKRLLQELQKQIQ